MIIRMIQRDISNHNFLLSKNPQTLSKYEYSPIQEAKEYKDLEVFEDPDVRYYVCVVDKNRAGAKPTLLFRLNLAYNYWEELGYVRLKQEFLTLD